MMKTIMPLLLCCLLSSALVFAQSADEKAVADAVEKFSQIDD
jgi:outer membrane lipoprotein-sorting protein